MPRPLNSTTKAAGGVSGNRTVDYVHIDGSTHTALVTGGSGTTLNLRVPSLPAANRQKSGIARRTALGQTNVWY